MAKERTEGRRGQSARAARKRYQNPAELARAREWAREMQAAGAAWREANPEAVRAATERGRETLRANREAAGIEKMVILQARVRLDQMEYLQTRAAQCPCPVAELLRGIIDAAIYEVSEEGEAA